MHVPTSTASEKSSLHCRARHAISRADRCSAGPRYPELIQSPIFGLETLDSPQVASLRRELRSLKGVAGEAPADGGRTVASETAASPRPASQAARSKRMKQIETELNTVPTWSEVPEYLQSTNELLRQISGELSSGSGSARRSKRSTKSRSDGGNGGES